MAVAKADVEETKRRARRRFSRKTVQRGEAAAQRFRLAMEIAVMEPHAMTLGDAADMMGLSTSCVTNWLRGDSLPLKRSIDLIDEFCGLFEIEAIEQPLAKDAHSHPPAPTYSFPWFGKKEATKPEPFEVLPIRRHMQLPRTREEKGTMGVVTWMERNARDEISRMYQRGVVTGVTVAFATVGALGMVWVAAEVFLGVKW